MNSGDNHSIDKVREDAWYLMSDLFLDTELLENDLERMAKEFAASPFSVDELNAMYEDEVAPVLHGNLKCVAGVWGCFSRDEIIPLIRQRASWLKEKRRHGIPIVEAVKRAMILGETKEQWRQILERIKVIRALK